MPRNVSHRGLISLNFLISVELHERLNAVLKARGGSMASFGREDLTERVSQLEKEEFELIQKLI